MSKAETVVQYKERRRNGQEQTKANTCPFLLRHLTPLPYPNLYDPTNHPPSFYLYASHIIYPSLFFLCLASSPFNTTHTE